MFYYKRHKIYFSEFADPGRQKDVKSEKLGKMATTRIDVAKKAGVSKTTVSDVLNNKYNARIKEKTRQKVLDTALELNYKPNVLARSLTKQRIQHIGVAVSNREQAETGFFSKIMHGIREESEANDYYPLLCPLQDRTSPEASEILGSMVRTGRVDGLIINKEDLLSAEVIKMAEQNLPLVLINGSVPPSKKPLYSVCIDNFQGACQAVKYLAELGHQRIGFVNREYESIPLGFRRIVDTERLEGYKAALQKRGLKYEDSLVIEGALLNKAKVYSAVDRLMKLPLPPTAFFVVDDTMALSVMHCLFSKGLRIPEDVSVVGYGDLNIALITEPSLTTVQAQLSEMGRLATKMLIQILDGKEVIKNTHILLKPSLVLRESCAPKLQRRPKLVF